MSRPFRGFKDMTEGALNLAICALAVGLMRKFPEILAIARDVVAALKSTAY